MKSYIAARRRKSSANDKIFDIVNVLVMVLLLVIFLWPLWFIVIASVSSPAQVWLGNVLLLPKQITTTAYKALIEYRQLWVGYGNTIFYTVAGTALNLVLTICCAYPLSRKDFVPGKILLLMILFTMYFSGGMIAKYLVVSRLGLLDTRWAMILPGAISVYNMLVMRTYFMNSIPEELYEASVLDGANSAQYLMKIVLPLSKSVMAVVSLYYAVSHWNDFYTALLYIYDEKLRPLQTVLRELLLTSSRFSETLVGSDAVTEQLQLAQTMKYSIIVVSSLPMLCLYPFIQKFFVKGVMIGAVKG